MADTLRRRRQRTPQVEQREAITLLSGATMPAGLTGAPAAAAVSSASTYPTTLNATFRGVYSYSRPIPDAGTTYSFFATTFLNGVGPAIVSGTITTPGFIPTGRATGTLTIVSGRGTIRLQVTGPTEPGFGPLPSPLAFQVTGASGFFRFLSGQGTLTVGLTPASGSTALHGSGSAVLAFREPKSL